MRVVLRKMSNGKWYWFGVGKPIEATHGDVEIWESNQSQRVRAILRAKVVAIVIERFLGSALGWGIQKLFEFALLLVFLFYPALMMIAALLIALVDVIFRGRYGISVIGGLIATLAIDSLIQRRWPRWYRAHWLNFEGVSVKFPLLWIGLGLGLWYLSGDAFPDVAPETTRLLARISYFFHTSPYFSWLVATPEGCSETGAP